MYAETTSEEFVCFRQKREMVNLKWIFRVFSQNMWKETLCILSHWKHAELNWMYTEYMKNEYVRILREHTFAWKFKYLGGFVTKSENISDSSSVVQIGSLAKPVFYKNLMQVYL